MHCVSTYPMNYSDANLKTIITLKEKYKCNVGYSGHETGLVYILCGGGTRNIFIRKAYNFG